MNKKEVEKILFFPSWMKVLRQINSYIDDEISVAELSRDAKTCYTQTLKIIDALEKMKLVHTRDKDRSRYVIATIKGTAKTSYIIKLMQGLQ